MVFSAGLEQCALLDCINLFVGDYELCKFADLIFTHRYITQSKKKTFKKTSYSPYHHHTLVSIHCYCIDDSKRGIFDFLLSLCGFFIFHEENSL